MPKDKGYKRDRDDVARNKKGEIVEGDKKSVPSPFTHTMESVRAYEAVQKGLKRAIMRKRAKHK